MDFPRKAMISLPTSSPSRTAERSDCPALVPVIPDAISRQVPNAWMLPLLLAGQAMAAMDTSIANVAAPALRDDLGISGAVLQMVVAGYGLAYAVLLITGARLGDDFGYRRMFMIGVSIFTIASLACGAAPFPALLILGRLTQGLGAALMVPQVLSLIQRSFAGPERARAIAYFSMILGLGAAAGQLLGGVAIYLDIWGLNWRPAFLVNVPIGLLLLARARAVLPDLKGEVRRPLDMTGVLLLSTSMSLIIVTLTFGRELGWPRWTWLCLGMGAAGLAAFWRWEATLTARGGHPLLQLGAVLAPGARPGLLVVMIGFFGYGGWLFAIALYLQSGLHLTPVVSGLVFMAYALGFGLSNMYWSKLPPRLLRWIPALALLTLVVASLGVSWTVGGGWQPKHLVVLLFLAGSGHGLSFGTTVHQITLRTTPGHAPAMSGLITTASQLSIVLGIAVLGSLYLWAARDGAPSYALQCVTVVIASAALIAAGSSLRLATLRAGS